MIPEEYKALIDKITYTTNAKKCRWETTSDSSKFILKIGNNSVTIDLFDSFPDNISTVGFEIRNAFGERIDGIYIEHEENDYDQMLNLYSSARRNALRIEETISDIMKDLEGM